MADELIPAAKQLADLTFDALIGGWLENFRINLPKIREGLNLLDFPKREGEPCILVGAGPSLKNFRHLSMIKRAKWKHPVLCCDRVLINCLKNKIVPHGVATVDGSPLIAKYYNHTLVKFYADRINTALCTTVHPKTVATLKGKIYWFTPMLDAVTTGNGRVNKRALTYALYLLSKRKAVISGIGNVGSFLWNLSTELGCSPLILIGYDFSEQVKTKEQAIYFAHFTRLFLKDKIKPEEAMDKAALVHQLEENPDFIWEGISKQPYYIHGKPVRYLVNPIWKSYRDMLKAHIISSKIHTISATGNGCLHTKAIDCPNFEAMNLEKALRTFN